MREVKVKVEGKVKSLEKLEEVKRLIREAENILYRMPMEIEVILVDDTGKDDTISADPDSQ